MSFKRRYLLFGMAAVMMLGACGSGQAAIGSEQTVTGSEQTVAGSEETAEAVLGQTETEENPSGGDAARNEETAEAALGDRRPMVMVNGEIYLDTGRESDITGRCGIMDGEITSEVDGSEIPVKNDQSNFGTGYGYQYVDENSIDVLLPYGSGSEDMKWIRFEKEQTEAEERGKVFVGINAHIKEIGQDGSILISSDSDGFPGAFLVEVPEGICEPSLLKGGTLIRILMQDLEKQDAHGLLWYLACEISLREDEGTEPDREAFLLTSAPSFVLKNALFDGEDFVEIKSGNYSWNSKKGDGMTSTIACGSHPLYEVMNEHAASLKLPQYKDGDSVVYSFSCGVLPDRLTVSEWSAEDIGSDGAQEISVVTFYDPIPFLELKAGRVYEFAAVWEEENLEQNGFFGNAGYALKTE